MTDANILPIVLSGGSGARLWPLSRRQSAKQYAPLADGRSPFQHTLKRLCAPGLFQTPLVICSHEGRFMALDQAQAVGVGIDTAMEPEGRDTAAAVALAAALAARRDPQTIVLVAPSDHLIKDVAAFHDAVRAAAEAAAQGHICSIAIAPSGPATGFGYIRPGERLSADARKVAAFVEKPDAARAEALIAEGCLWNSGMFCFRAADATPEIARLAPDTAAAVELALDEAEEDLGALRLGPSWSQAPRISFDYAVMEKTDRAAVVESAFGWSDIGDWRAVWEQADRDKQGNAVGAHGVAVDSHDVYLRSDARLVCALGVQGLAVVDTPDAVLVAPLERAGEVKGLVAMLAEMGRPEADTPARVHRPWGWHQTLDKGDRFRVKRIQVAPGRKLSLQKHVHRAEHWVVVRGAAEVTRDDETFLLRENESVYLPQGCAHRLANPGKIPVEIVEVQTGAYLEEDDIVRIQDDFGRG